MKTFTDEAGRVWEVAINVTAVKRLRAHLDLDLLALVESDRMAGLAELLADPIRLVDALYVICMDQCKAATPPLSDEDFGRGMAGDAIVRGAGAFASELADFYPSPRVRAALRATIEAWARIDERATELTTRHLATTTATFDETMGRMWAKVEREMAEETARTVAAMEAVEADVNPNPLHRPAASSGSSGDSPASSASTPGPSPGVNST